MMVSDTTPTRKQRFDAALKLAGITLAEFCSDVGVTYNHVNYVLRGERPGGPGLNAAIDALIAKHLGSIAA